MRCTCNYSVGTMYVHAIIVLVQCVVHAIIVLVQCVVHAIMVLVQCIAHGLIVYAHVLYMVLLCFYKSI